MERKPVDLADLDSRMVTLDQRLTEIRDDNRSRSRWLETFTAVLLALIVWSIGVRVYLRWSLQSTANSANTWGR